MIKLLFGRFSIYHLIEGNTFYSEENYNEALNSYDKALRINSNYAYAYQKKGDTLYALGNYFEAIDCYNSALRIGSDDNGTVYHNKGLTFYGLAKLAVMEKKLILAEERLNEAVECFDQVIGMKAKNAEIKKQEAINLREEIRTALVIKFIEENPTNFYQDSYKLRLFESCKPIIQKYLTKQRESKEAFEDKQENSNIPGYKIWLIDFLSNVNYEKCIKSFENETKSRFFKVIGICKNIDEQYPALAMDNVRVIASFLSIADINLEDVNPDLLGENSTQITCITWPFEL